MPAKKRKPIGKKKRFEIFKRDRFTCQYCGAKAPDAVLHVDHIVPVASGGGNEFTNLITSCQGCNSGKGKRTLSDDTVVKMQHQELSDLQDRRDQLELMELWHKDLLEFENSSVDSAVEYFESISSYHLCQEDQNTIRRVIKRFGFDEVVESLFIVVQKYVRFDRVGNPCEWSVRKALKKVGGVCYNREQREADNGNEN